MPEEFKQKFVEGKPQSPEVEKATTLPNQEEMLERLRKVSTDQSLEAKFYPSLLKEAGNEFNGIGIAMVFLGAVRDYIDEVYKGEKNMTSLEAQALVANRVSQYIDALIDDPVVAAEAKAEVNDAIPHMATLFQPKKKK